MTFFTLACTVYEGSAFASCLPFSVISPLFPDFCPLTKQVCSARPVLSTLRLLWGNQDKSRSVISETLRYNLLPKSKGKNQKAKVTLLTRLRVKPTTHDPLTRLALLATLSPKRGRGVRRNLWELRQVCLVKGASP